MSKKKVRIIIIALVVVAVGVGVFFGVKAYNNYITQQQIETRQKDIESAINRQQQTRFLLKL